MIALPRVADELQKIYNQKVYDDFVDQLNFRITPSILLFFALATSTKTLFGSPIQCWVPPEYSKSWEEYSEDYCFIKDTYYIPISETIPKFESDREDKELRYYQWVPVVLALQALFFLIPNQIFRGLCAQTGINFSAILSKSVQVAGLTDIEKREKEIEILGNYVKSAIMPSGCRQSLFFNIKESVIGSLTTILYLSTKLLNLGNVAGQFFLLNAFIGTKYRFWGIEILNDLLQGREWQESGHFPRVTLCDFKIRMLGNTHKYSMQCVLMLNVFNEYIYIAIWFWFLFVGIMTGLNAVYWIIACSIPYFRFHLVRRFIRASSGMNDQPSFFHDSQIRRFVKSIHADGVLLLRFVSCHAGDFTAMELTRYLYDARPTDDNGLYTAKPVNMDEFKCDDKLKSEKPDSLSSAESQGKRYDYTKYASPDPDADSTTYAVSGFRTAMNALSSKKIRPSTGVLPNVSNILPKGLPSRQGVGHYPRPSTNASRPTTLDP